MKWQCAPMWADGRRWALVRDVCDENGLLEAGRVMRFQDCPVVTATDYEEPWEQEFATWRAAVRALMRRKGLPVRDGL